MAEEWTRDQCAQHWGIKPDTWSGYVTRGQAPRPSRRIGRTPLWDVDTVRTYGRPGPGARTDRRTMNEIASHIPGRDIHSYDLLEEMVDRYGISRREAHDAIHAYLEQCIDIDGEDAVVLDRRPIRPELVKDNPHDLDVYYWLTITDETAETIRESFAASYTPAS